MLMSENYKAIIIAARLGSRLGKLTEQKPKCMLELNGKSILQHQLDAYKANGIADVSVAGGYKKEEINLPARSDLSAILHNRHFKRYART